MNRAQCQYLRNSKSLLITGRSINKEDGEAMSDVGYHAAMNPKKRDYIKCDQV